MLILDEFAGCEGSRQEHDGAVEKSRGLVVVVVGSVLVWVVGGASRGGL